jgi:hypothetical protein
LGAGFGGLTFCKQFRHAAARAAVVDCTNHHLFPPLLYQVATAGLSAPEIAQPIRSILSDRFDVTVLLDRVVDFDLANKKVFLERDTLSWDYLVLAMGSQTGYFSGFVAWLAWLFVHLIFLIGFRNRVAMLIQWIYSYFTYKRGARIITTRSASRTAGLLCGQCPDLKKTIPLFWFPLNSRPFAKFADYRKKSLSANYANVREFLCSPVDCERATSCCPLYAEGSHHDA